jgi:hypothetical protein
MNLKFHYFFLVFKVFGGHLVISLKSTSSFILKFQFFFTNQSIVYQIHIQKFIWSIHKFFFKKIAKLGVKIVEKQQKKILNTNKKLNK